MSALRKNGNDGKNGNELCDDYGDYLRARDLRQWGKASKEALFVRQLGRQQPQTYELYREFMQTRPPEVLANIAICLINQATYLIDRHLDSLEKAFIQEGGLREKMTRVRLEYRQGQHRNLSSTTHAPHHSHSSHSAHSSAGKGKEQVA